jgi:hypothetical protein
VSPPLSPLPSPSSPQMSSHSPPLRSHSGAQPAPSAPAPYEPSLPTTHKGGDDCGMEVQLAGWGAWGGLTCTLDSPIWRCPSSVRVLVLLPRQPLPCRLKFPLNTPLLEFDHKPSLGTSPPHPPRAPPFLPPRRAVQRTPHPRTRPRVRKGRPRPPRCEKRGAGSVASSSCGGGTTLAPFRSAAASACPRLLPCPPAHAGRGAEEKADAGPARGGGARGTRGKRATPHTRPPPKTRVDLGTLCVRRFPHPSPTPSPPPRAQLTAPRSRMARTKQTARKSTVRSAGGSGGARASLRPRKNDPPTAPNVIDVLAHARERAAARPARRFRGARTMQMRRRRARGRRDRHRPARSHSPALPYPPPPPSPSPSGRQGPAQAARHQGGAQERARLRRRQEAPPLPPGHRRAPRDPPLPEVHRAAHPQAPLPAPRPRARPGVQVRPPLPEHRHPRAPGVRRGLPRRPLRGHQPVRHPRQARHHHAQGHPARPPHPRGARVGAAPRPRIPRASFHCEGGGGAG